MNGDISMKLITVNTLWCWPWCTRCLVLRQYCLAQRTS